MATTHTYDALVIGAGGAGMRAAIELSDQVRTAVISKLYPTRSHTGAAQGGVCAALGNTEEDHPEWHAFDTVKGGDYLTDQPAAMLMTEEAIDAIYQLERWGLPFNRTPDGRIDQRRFGGHTAEHGERPVRRACYAADRTGHMILQTLYQQCVKRDVRFFNEFYCLDLLRDADGAAAGVVAYELATGELHVFRAKSIVFATGGYGRMFSVTSNAHALTGDGPAVAWRRGVPLEDMEMFQFHPTGLAKLGVLLSEAARGEGGIVLNKDGERFMERYAPTIKDLAPRDMVSRAIYQEIKEGRGGGPNGDWAFLDIRHLDPKVIEEKLPDITEFARVYLKVEPTKEPVPIQPTAHYAMGGIPTDVDGRVVEGADETPIPGLYAAGECACVSVHGANRLGTNSLLDLVVFGRRAGVDAGRHAKEAAAARRARAPHGADALDARTPCSNGPRVTTRPTSARSCRRACSTSRSWCEPRRACRRWRRSSAGLQERYARVAITDKGALYNTDLMETVEVGYLLDCAQALVVSARARTESRGAHYRDDHPAARRRELAEAHARLSQRRRLDPPRLQAGEDGALRADGEEVLMATPGDVLQDSDGRRAGAPTDLVTLTLRIRRFNPEVSQDSWWDEFTVEADPLERLVEVLHQVKWYHDGTLSFRRSCAHGICGSDAMLINGRNALACKVLVDDVGLEGHDRADPRPAGPEGPDRRHGAVPRRLQGRAALPHQRFRASPSASACSRPRNAPASTTPRSASCAPPAPPRARSSGATRATSARPRS